MFDHDPRDQDARAQDDGVRDREEDWVVLGRGANSASLRGEEPDPRDRDEERRAERDRDSRDREDLRTSIDPRDVFSRDLDLPRRDVLDIAVEVDRPPVSEECDLRATERVARRRQIDERIAGIQDLSAAGRAPEPFDVDLDLFRRRRSDDGAGVGEGRQVASPRQRDHRRSRCESAGR